MNVTELEKQMSAELEELQAQLNERANSVVNSDPVCSNLRGEMSALKRTLETLNRPKPTPASSKNGKGRGKAVSSVPTA